MNDEICLELNDKEVRKFGRLSTALEICYCEGKPWKSLLTLYREDVGEITLRLTDSMMQDIVELFMEISDES